MTILNKENWVHFCEKYLQDVNALHIPICRSFEVLIPSELRVAFAERNREATAVAQLTTVGLCTPVRNYSSRTGGLPTDSTYDYGL